MNRVVERTELEAPPSLPPLYARAILGALVPGGGDQLPEREILVRGADIDPDRVADYARVCGLRFGGDAPGTYPHVLAFPLHLRLMTERSFPFGVLGMVHIANRIEALAPIHLGSRLDLRARAEGLRAHRRGRQFDLLCDAELDGRPVWRERSTYLHREEGHEERSSSGSSPDSERRDQLGGEEGAGAPVAEWRVPGDIGRRYAAVSGDRNPIHLHELSARAFGFPGAIAHGMWTAARCLAAFEGRIGDAYALEVEFGSPLRIPGRARLLTRPREGGWEFAVTDPRGERTHLRGSIVG